MRQSLNTHTFRKRAAIAAAGLAATAAIAAPGIAWASDSAPHSPVIAAQELGPAVAGEPLDATNCEPVISDLSPEKLQEMIADATALPTAPVVSAPPVDETGRTHTRVVTDEESQRMIADGSFVEGGFAGAVTRIC